MHLLDSVVAAVAALEYGHVEDQVGAEVLPQRSASMEGHLIADTHQLVSLPAHSVQSLSPFNL